MREKLAERILAKVMKWKPKDMAREMPDLLALASYKYDEYQQFSPGMKFIESFALWLHQFETDEERKKAYEYVREKLIFISEKEMAHLVTISYPDVIKPILIQQVANSINMPEYNVTKIVKSQEFDELRRKSLFLGLSDGAHTDIFRRNNSEISHEQIYQVYEISRERAKDMLDNLEEDLTDILKEEPSKEDTRFRIVFLLDDFSGSGISYLRHDSNTDSGYNGKIEKFLTEIQDENNPMHLLFNSTDVHICIVLYLATTQARRYLNKLISEKSNSEGPTCTIQIVHEVKDSEKINTHSDKEFIELLEKYYDPDIEDKHYKKGLHDKPFLGFDECSIPLILYHNTPNNSLPILWFEDRKYRGLFPRVSRHGRSV
ncbi:MAG: hypothetical protein K8S18_14175 [Desulfobacula sp.]|nr:hypothetical protein [Desulfobacula sp.]